MCRECTGMAEPAVDTTRHLSIVQRMHWHGQTCRGHYESPQQCAENALAWPNLPWTLRVTSAVCRECTGMAEPTVDTTSHLSSVQRMHWHGRTCRGHYKTPQQCAENALARLNLPWTLQDTSAMCRECTGMAEPAVDTTRHLSSVQRMHWHGRTCRGHYKTPQQCAENAPAWPNLPWTLQDTSAVCRECTGMAEPAVDTTSHLSSVQRMHWHGRTCCGHYKTPQHCAENALAWTDPGGH